MLPDASHQDSAQEDIWFGRCCLKNFKKAANHNYPNGMFLAILSLHVALYPIKSLLKRSHGLEDVV